MKAPPLLDQMTTLAYPRGIPGDVCDTFERLALELIASGFDRYSTDAILHRVRWHWQVERGDRGFKCNSNWTTFLARWFVRRHPELRNAGEGGAAAPIRAYAD